MCAIFFVFLLQSFQNYSQPHCGPARKEQATVLSGQCLNFSEQRSTYIQIERHLYQVRINYYSKYLKMCTKFRNICVLQILNNLNKVNIASSKCKWCLTCHCLSKVRWLWSVFMSQWWGVLLAAVFACS